MNKCKNSNIPETNEPELPKNCMTCKYSNYKDICTCKDSLEYNTYVCEYNVCVNYQFGYKLELGHIDFSEDEVIIDYNESEPKSILKGEEEFNGTAE